MSLLPPFYHKPSLRRKNSYGYIHTNMGTKAPWPGAQLQNLLGMEENSFKPIKKHIVQLMKKHMNLNFTGSEQPANLDLIEKEITEQHPDIFATENEKKMYFVSRLVLHLHATRRSAYFTKRHDPGNKNQQNEVAITTNNNLVPPSVSNQGEGVLGSHNHVMPPSASSFSRSNNEALKKPDTTPPTTRTLHDPNQYRDIHNFLGASIPPLTHLMDTFIDFGCTNADFLLAISSWSSERIREALEQLSLGHHDRRFTDMEKFILENHFKEYFAQKENSGL